MSIKSSITPLLVVCLGVFLICNATAQSAAGDDIWQRVSESAVSPRGQARQVTPRNYAIFRLNRTAIQAVLRSAPDESSRVSLSTLTLPMPDGSLTRFRIERSLVVEPGLLVKFPELGETYRGQGIDDPTATVRFDLLPSGFHAMVRSDAGTVIVDPYSSDETLHYISYFKREADRSTRFECEVGPPSIVDTFLNTQPGRSTDLLVAETPSNVISGTQLRTYRLALAANNEYASTVGGNTVAGTLAAQVLVMNRVNGVYERDLAIRMVIVANNDLVIYAGDNTTCPVGTGGSPCTSSNDPYSNGTGALSQNTPNLNAVIGTANYDIGHVFTTGSGGVASLRVPCGSNKGNGTTGLGNPVGDPFAIDYVAHEMGHQFGGNHTMNGCSRTASAAYEPGSGITIMAYAGICSTQDLAAHSIDTFHVKSLEEIVAFSTGPSGGACPLTTPTNNTPPSVAPVGGTSFNIPKSTPFALTASATDVDGDSITYDWQEYDLGASGSGQVPNWDNDGQPRPIFRPFLPTVSGTRIFPQIQHILSSSNVPPPTTDGFLTGEMLPSITRTMNFQVVARDNRAAGGGINTATVTVSVDGASGPFAVGSPNGGETVPNDVPMTVTWNVANTNSPPVNASNVRISLSTDSGQSYPHILANSTPNDGSETVILPGTATTARIKIEAIDNIFFDVSNADFAIQPAPTPRAVFDFDGDGKTDIAIHRPGVPGGAEWWFQRSSDSQVAALVFGASTDTIVPADYTGDGLSDVAVFRPATSSWFILRSDNGTFYSFPFGSAGDVPMPADYDGDGKADAAVYRPSNSLWVILRSADGQAQFTTFGTTGDQPVAADYDGDGKADVGIFRPSGGSGSAEWWIQRSTAGLLAVAFGTSTDRAIPGDYTGDGKTDIAFYRPSNIYWFVLRSEDFSFYAFPWGQSNDTPVPGDYDGDGKTDAAIFRGGTWFVNRSSGTGPLVISFGLATDVPVPSAFVR